MKHARSLFGTATLVLAAAYGCASSPPPIEEAPPPPPPPAELSPAPVESAASPTPGETPKPVATAPKAPTPAWRVADGIATPESVLYDAAGDRYLVSNINGKPTDADNNGYITEIAGDGKVTKAKFIEGGAGKTKLDGPKGSGISGGVLYVADITVVRKFDAKTGAPKGDIPVKDAVFLNDISIAADGRIFVSDSGLKLGASGLEPAGGDAVYSIDKAGKVKTVAKSKDLSGPNGVLATDKGLLVNTFGSDEVYRLDDKGAKQDVTKLPAGGLDGLVAAGDSFFVSSWKAATVFKGKLGQKFEPALEGVQGPADIAYDAKRSRVVVPRFMDNAVEAYDVK